MGRRKLEDSDGATQALDAMSQDAENRELVLRSDDERFLENGETYNLHLCMEKARMYQEQMANGLLGLGAQLILIKNHEEHGSFMAAVEDLGLASRSANYAMAAARKFGNSPTLANLGSSKIKALTVLDDDDVAQLSDGAEVSGLGTVDDIAKMSIRELRNALRKEKKEREDERIALEEVVCKKESTISALEMEVAGRQPPTQEQLAGLALDEMRKSLVGSLSVAKDTLTSARILIANAQETEGVTVEQLDKWIEDASWIASLLDDTYQELMQDMENIRPARQEE
ncbi:hypothetical protein [Treponema pectinovorum]|uniref:hypothetical protein n=1 Tax=Treponema pectinovorum TaxID=164 RepID=UPI0011CAADA9|nr:hypothetical protein [Treponema pectinovorum]